MTDNSEMSPQDLPHDECGTDCWCHLGLSSPDRDFVDVPDIGATLETGLLDYAFPDSHDLHLECDDDSLYTFPQDICDQLHQENNENGTIAGTLLKILFNREKADSDRFKCDMCQKTSTRLSLVLDHRYKEHQVEYQFKCKLCPYAGNMYRHLKAHIKRQHSNQPMVRKPPAPTEQYDRKNKAEKVVSKPGEENHPQAENLGYTCNFNGCNKTFKSRKRLHEHSKVVHGERAHKCQTCGKDFTMERYLKAHMVQHSALFTCTWEGCQKSFRDNHNLQCHIKTHTKDKDLHCAYCDYACIQKASMMWHVNKCHKN